jgi:hypothetical protein
LFLEQGFYHARKIWQHFAQPLCLASVVVVAAFKYLKGQPIIPFYLPRPSGQFDDDVAAWSSDRQTIKSENFAEPAIAPFGQVRDRAPV